MLIFYDILDSFAAFMRQGGNVLWLIAGLVVVMWCLILERLWYFFFEFPMERAQYQVIWEQRADRRSLLAHWVRDQLTSQVRMRIYTRISLIKTCIALCPLFGLLGTVTGMIEVFTVMAFTGGGNARAMAGGVSHATMPTMAGMVAALSGLFAMIWLDRKVSSESELFATSLSTT